MRNLTAIFVLFLNVLTLAGCDGTANKEPPAAQPSATQGATSNTEVMNMMDKFFQEGMKRPFGPSGPRFELPSSYYEFFASNMQEASGFLDAKLTSTHGVELMNGYDIVIHMASFPLSRAWALSKMKQAIDSGDPIKYMVQPAYDQLTKVTTSK